MAKIWGEEQFWLSDSFRLTQRLGVGDVGTGENILNVVSTGNTMYQATDFRASRDQLLAFSIMPGSITLFFRDIIKIEKLNTRLQGSICIWRVTPEPNGPQRAAALSILSPEGASGLSFALMPETPSRRSSSFAVNGCLSTSISLVGDKDNGGLDEFRFGVRTGTDDDDDKGKEEGGVARVLHIAVSHAEEEAFEFTTLLNAAVAGNRGKMTAAGKICGWPC